jgi:2,3-bisphosphoglycerate-independent phosphoglycerate mutase
LSIDSENDTIITAKHATEHRIGLKITNNYLSDQITGTDPLKDNLKLKRVKAKIPEA